MSIHHQAAKYGRELSLPGAEVVENEPAATYARRVKLKAKQTKEKYVDQDKTHNWLSTPGLKSVRAIF